METVVILLYSWENREEMNMDGVPCACLSYLPCHLIYIIKHNKYFNILLIQFPGFFFFFLVMSLSGFVIKVQLFK